MSKTDGQQLENPESRCVMVCQHQSCQRNNAAEVLQAFEREADSLASVTITSSGCMGQCSTGPTVRVMPDEIWYYRVKPEDVEAIARQHLEKGQPVDRLLNPRIHIYWEML